MTKSLQGEIKTRADVNAAIEQVNQDFKSVANTASRDWSAVKAKVASDAAALKAGIEARKHDLTVARAENYAEMLEDEAAFAIDYAISSVEQAKLAALDAIVGRAEAERAKAS